MSIREEFKTPQGRINQEISTEGGLMDTKKAAVWSNSCTDDERRDIDFVIQERIFQKCDHLNDANTQNDEDERLSTGIPSINAQSSSDSLPITQDSNLPSPLDYAITAEQLLEKNPIPWHKSREKIYEWANDMCQWLLHGGSCSEGATLFSAQLTRATNLIQCLKSKDELFHHIANDEFHETVASVPWESTFFGQISRPEMSEFLHSPFPTLKETARVIYTFVKWLCKMETEEHSEIISPLTVEYQEHWHEYLPSGRAIIYIECKYGSYLASTEKGRATAWIIQAFGLEVFTALQAALTLGTCHITEVTPAAIMTAIREIVKELVVEKEKTVKWVDVLPTMRRRNY